ncbi:MAG: aminoacyl-tRNA hydrolase [Candidatus Gracilibacteria bacterium]|jgi:PTH1 family peptidyl-tRNA hydrolase
MKIIVGLGNPGDQYEKTRHNVGFMCVNALRGVFGFDDWKLNKKFNAEIAEGTYENEKIVLVKPQTFMNASGEAVSKVVNFYNVPHADLWVIYDDVDIPLGKIRIRADGTPGSHNGIKSVVELLGFQDFPRIRIGIESRGETASKEQEIASFVLHSFLKEEESLAKEAVENAAAALVLAIKNGLQAAQYRFN